MWAPDPYYSTVLILKGFHEQSVNLESPQQEELIDEDDLLDAADWEKPAKSSLTFHPPLTRMVVVTDCSTKPRACKNCSCGRAEEEAAAAPVLLKPKEENFKSSCGNVWLLDRQLTLMDL